MDLAYLSRLFSVMFFAAAVCVPATWADDAEELELELDPANFIEEPVPSGTASDTINNERGEADLTRGVVAYRDKKYDEAERDFLQALKKAPESIVALEHLASIHELRRNYHASVEWLKKAVAAAPRQRSGKLNLNIARMSLLIGDNEQAKRYYLAAIPELKGLELADAEYSLGYLYFREGEYLAAERHLNEARWNKAFRQSFKDGSRSQALNYYLGEAYARSGYPRYASALLSQAEYGPSRDIRVSAWRVHAEIDKPEIYLLGAMYGQYDSMNGLYESVNGRLLSKDEKSSGAALFALRGGGQSAPLKRWSYGGDGLVQGLGIANQSLSQYSASQLGGTLWGEYWNQRDFSARLAYDWTTSFRDGSRLVKYETVHGPSLSLNYFPRQQWNWELGVQRRSYTYFGFASDRAGHALAPFLQLALRAPGPSVKPWLRYSNEGSETVNPSYSSRSHIAAVGFQLDVSPKTQLVAEGSRSWSKLDRLTRVRLGFNHALDLKWALAGEASHARSQSSFDQGSYERLVVAGGLAYRFR